MPTALRLERIAYSWLTLYKVQVRVLRYDAEQSVKQFEFLRYGRRLNLEGALYPLRCTELTQYALCGGCCERSADQRETEHRCGYCFVNDLHEGQGESQEGVVCSTTKGSHRYTNQHPRGDITAAEKKAYIAAVLCETSPKKCCATLLSRPEASPRLRQNYLHHNIPVQKLATMTLLPFI